MNSIKVIDEATDDLLSKEKGERAPHWTTTKVRVWTKDESHGKILGKTRSAWKMLPPATQSRTLVEPPAFYMPTLCILKEREAPKWTGGFTFIQMLTASTPILLLEKSVTFSDNLTLPNLFSPQYLCSCPHTWLWVPFTDVQGSYLSRWQARDHEALETIRHQNHDL